MKIRHNCKECGHIGYGTYSVCPSCESTEVSTTKTVNLHEWDKETNSSKYTVCYTFGRDGKKVKITGRSPEKDIDPGVILFGVPYNGVQGLDFKVKKIEYRPHRGEMSHLFHWTADCEEV